MEFSRRIERYFFENEQLTTKKNPFLNASCSSLVEKYQLHQLYDI